MELIKVFKDDMTNRINEKCDELYKKISDENVEFENNYIQLNIKYFEKYSEMLNKTNYDVSFYIESWCGFRTLLDLVYKNFFDVTLNEINDVNGEILRDLKETYKDKETITLGHYFLKMTKN